VYDVDWRRNHLRRHVHSRPYSRPDPGRVGCEDSRAGVEDNL